MCLGGGGCGCRSIRGQAGCGGRGNPFAFAELEKGQSKRGGVWVIWIRFVYY